MMQQVRTTSLASQVSDRRRAGLSRGEIVVCIVCILFLLGIAAPIILQQRELQRQIGCQLRQSTIHTAFKLMLDQHNGEYPWLHDGEASWAEHLIPYLTAAQRERKQTQVMADDDTASEQIVGYLCPNGRAYEPGSLSYVVNGGWGQFTLSQETGLVRAGATVGIDWDENGELTPEDVAQTRATGIFWPLGSSILPLSAAQIESADGLSYTILATESQTSTGWRSDRVADLAVVIDVDQIQLGEDAAQPFAYRAADLGAYRINAASESGPHGNPNSTHPGGVNILFADGSVQFLSAEIDDLVYVRLTTPLGQAYGESVDPR